ncbi:hypothetical protein CTAYLR_010235 [Chrysophaeum taylorii]|uniref:GYF domain-containing protein n=1 Tax=Chrysophaeum taylorii TaxID=2483200 RepID=A0AAD7U7V4_9STRA|nr:hypothetical protein CTAYLR_010235 [Chrysophaeum taylorii]
MTEAVVGEEETTVNEAGLEPFNLRSERENDGFFDANGNFVWRREKEEPDAWLAQLDEAATEKGIGESSKRRIVEEKDEEVDVEGAARTLGSLLVNGETVAGALRRLGKDLPASRTDFDTLASLADILVRAGKDVYDQTAEAFLPPDTRTWEYKGADGQIHGPFATKHILAWRSAGFFVGDMAVPMRECAAAETDDFLADLEEEEEEEEERDWRSSGTIDFFAPKQPLLLESDTYVERLREAVGVPGVAALLSHRPHIRSMLEYAQRWCEDLGATTRMVENPLAPEDPSLPPLLCATFECSNPEAVTVLAYGHLDVQPADKKDGWDTEPFELTEIDGKLYGRGASDDKGPALSWLWGIEALRDAGLELPVRLQILYEGCEEYGSLGLPEFIQREKNDWLRRVDYVVVSDNTWVGTSTPCLTYGLRGMAYFQVECKAGAADLHSGTHGGSLRSEPLVDLLHIMGSLVAPPDGRLLHERILIPGILDDVAPATAAERAKYESIDFDVNEYERVVGASLATSDKTDLLMARWRFPTLSVHGIEGAFSEPGAKTVIPACVRGKFSMRLVPSMTPERTEKKVRAHVEAEFAKLRSKNEMLCEMLHGGPAWVSDTDHPNYRAGAEATRRVFGRAPDLTREGGSIPLATWLEQGIGVSVLLLPTGAADDGHHAQNEKYNRSNYVNGIKLLATYLFELNKIATLLPKPSQCKCTTDSPVDLLVPGAFAFSRGFKCKCEL